VQQGYLDLAKGKAGADYYVDAQGRTVPKGYHFNAQGELVAVSTKQPPGAGPNFYTDKQGRRVPKGYEYNKKGQLVSITTGTKGGPSKGKSGPEIAASMAADARGTPRNEFNEILPPKKSWAAAYREIYSALIARGYPKKKASAWAHQAVNSAYGPGVGGRPGKPPAEFAG
jgi:hypothetical protein